MPRNAGHKRCIGCADWFEGKGRKCDRCVAFEQESTATTVPRKHRAVKIGDNPSEFHGYSETMLRGDQQ